MTTRPRLGLLFFALLAAACPSTTTPRPYAPPSAEALIAHIGALRQNNAGAKH